MQNSNYKDYPDTFLFIPGQKIIPYTQCIFSIEIISSDNYLTFIGR